MISNVLQKMAELEELRGNPGILFAASMEEDCIQVLYECFRIYGRMERLDLVLLTRGGTVSPARQIALLLREYVKELTILVPYSARSSGTLLCLAADHLVLGPLAELGPIDSHFGSAGLPPSDAPGMIAAEDIRAFRNMAEDWFGVDREEDRLQVLALIAQRIFPTSLSSFYRGDKLVRSIAHELLGFQNPKLEDEARQYIVDKLVGGYHAHDYILSRSELVELGLPVTLATSQEEDVLWDIQRACRSLIGSQSAGMNDETVGLILGARVQARKILRETRSARVQDESSQHENPQHQDVKTEIEWEIGGRCCDR